MEFIPITIILFSLKQILLYELNTLYHNHIMELVIKLGCHNRYEYKPWKNIIQSCLLLW